MAPPNVLLAHGLAFAAGLVSLPLILTLSLRIRSPLLRSLALLLLPACYVAAVMPGLFGLARSTGTLLFLGIGVVFGLLAWVSLAPGRKS